MSTYKETMAAGYRHTGLVPVVNIDGALHDVALMTTPEGRLAFIDATSGWVDVTRHIDVNAPVFFTRRRADNARIRLGLLAYAGRSATRLGLTVGETFKAYALHVNSEGDLRFEGIGSSKGLNVRQLVRKFLRQPARSQVI